MKKNKMLRLASVLLVLTLLTTSIIGGTLAKYVTSDSGTDTARVAKFGVVATVSGDLFGSTYAGKAGGNTIITYSKNGGTVSSGDAVKVIAPGTENKEGLTLSVAGTPEVSTKVSLGKAKAAGGADYADSDIYLASGEYGVMVEYKGVKTAENIGSYYAESSGTYTKATDTSATVYELRDAAKTDEDYYPLTWYVDNTAVGRQTDIAGALTGTGKFETDKTFKPNESNTLSATVGWEWKFRNGETEQAKAASDAKDTILGDMISGSAAVVKKSGDSYVAVQSKDIASGAGTVKVAYTGSEPDSVTGSGVCACLTAAYSASITVEQED